MGLGRVRRAYRLFRCVEGRDRGGRWKVLMVVMRLSQVRCI